MTLDAALRKLGLSNAEFGLLVPAHPTLVWKWRLRKVAPSGRSLSRILAVLTARGLDITIDDLLRKARRPADRRVADRRRAQRRTAS